VVAGVGLAVGAFVLHADAPYLFDGLTSRALPLVVVSATCGIGSLTFLLREFHRGARLLAGGAVAAMVASWGVAQWDYVLPESLTVADGAAPDGTLGAVLVATGLAVLLIFPSMAVLFRLGQKGLLPEEGVEVEA
jgi:cytochrome d ubiquinol oxidase subunit II